MALYFDHVVLNVHNLQKAIDDFKKAGFNVVSGGKHGGGISENALIFFQDDSFIELFCLRTNLKVRLLKFFRKLKFFKIYQYSKKWGLAYRFYSRALELPEGIVDICFLSDDYQSDYNRIHGDGLFLTKTLKASRKKPDGKRSSWQMASPFINELPFLRSPYTPESEVDPKLTVHENGAIGVEKMIIAALDFKDMTSKYETFLGLAPTSEEGKNGQKTIFRVKDTNLEVVKSSDHKGLRERLRAKGLGMYGLQFKRDKNVPGTSKIDECHGLVIVNE